MIACFVSLLALACDEPRSAPAPIEQTPPIPEVPASPVAPSHEPPPRALEGLDDPPPVPDEAAPVSGMLTERTPPPHGCVLLSENPQRVFEAASTLDVLDDGSAFVVAGYVGGDPERVGIARIVPGSLPQLLATASLQGHVDPERRSAPPILARASDSQLAVAVVDAEGRVQLAIFDPGLAAATLHFVEVAAHADPRFPPAVARIDLGRAVAYTDASDRTYLFPVTRADVPRLSPAARALAGSALPAHGHRHLHREVRGGLAGSFSRL